jgi:uncharacterized protein YkwD
LKEAGKGSAKSVSDPNPESKEMPKQTPEEIRQKMGYTGTVQELGKKPKPEELHLPPGSIRQAQRESRAERQLREAAERREEKLRRMGAQLKSETEGTASLAQGSTPGDTKNFERTHRYGRPEQKLRGEIPGITPLIALVVLVGVLGVLAWVTMVGGKGEEPTLLERPSSCPVERAQWRLASAPNGKFYSACVWSDKEVAFYNTLKDGFSASDLQKSGFVCRDNRSTWDGPGGGSSKDTWYVDVCESASGQLVFPTPTSTSLPTSTPRPTLTLVSKPTLVPSTPSSTSPIPDTTQELRLFMLDLINTDRINNGLEPLKLGSHLAAQLHAAELFRNGFLGHWGLDGLKPYMRYTLAGGTGAEAENVSGSNEPRIPGLRYAKTTVMDSLRVAQEGLMSSPGHRRNMLDPYHQRVNLGIACDNVSCTVAQQFESVYVNFKSVPSIEGGNLAVLSFSGQLLGGFVYYQTQVWYDPLPKPLKAAQIRATYCYDSGTPIVFIRELAPAGSYYTSNSNEYSWTNCLDPRDIDPASPPPRVTSSLPDYTGQVPSVDANLYEVQGSSFNIAVDVSKYTQEYGQGVYTIVIWGESSDGDTVPLTNFSIFREE